MILKTLNQSFGFATILNNKDLGLFKFNELMFLFISVNCLNFTFSLNELLIAFICEFLKTLILKLKKILMS